jgi:fructose-bisphosphate aldolase class II
MNGKGENMPVVSMKELIKDAQKRKYAIGNHNTIDYEAVKGIILAAEEMNAPVIIGIAQSQLEILPIDTLSCIFLLEAKKSKVPIAIHLDHGTSIQLIKKAIDLGFNSVMYDGSQLPFEDNISNTIEVVQYAKSKNVAVEAEIGKMINIENAKYNELSSSDSDKNDYTDPTIVGEFVERTKIDMLAVSYGSIHGLHAKKPMLNFDLLEQIHNTINIPLVLHGGSGLDASDYLKSINNGVHKINYYSFGYNAVAAEIKERILFEKEPIFYHDISNWSIEAFKNIFKETMIQFHSAGKA